MFETIDVADVSFQIAVCKVNQLPFIPLIPSVRDSVKALSRQRRTIKNKPTRSAKKQSPTDKWKARFRGGRRISNQFERGRHQLGETGIVFLLAGQASSGYFQQKNSKNSARTAEGDVILSKHRCRRRRAHLKILYSNIRNEDCSMENLFSINHFLTASLFCELGPIIPFLSIRLGLPYVWYRFALSKVFARQKFSK